MMVRVKKKGLNFTKSDVFYSIFNLVKLKRYLNASNKYDFMEIGALMVVVDNSLIDF